MFGILLAPVIKKKARIINSFLNFKSNRWLGANFQLLTFNSNAYKNVCTSTIAAGTQNKFTEKPSLVLNSAVRQIPHEDKAYKSGEDTYFISSNNRVVGVFDGVGGWNSSGVDPRKYALRISEGCTQAVDMLGYTDPTDILTFAHEQSLNVLGSCTACIVSLLENNQLSTLNLGDSGFLIIRPPKSVIYRSTDLQHSFNMPYQLGSCYGDRPESSDTKCFSVQPRDFILLATDGVFDNIENDVIVNMVHLHFKNSESNEEFSLQKLADGIAHRAWTTSLNKTVTTPFSKNAMKNGYLHVGGKPDDITILVSQVVETEQ